MTNRLAWQRDSQGRGWYDSYQNERIVLPGGWKFLEEPPEIRDTFYEVINFDLDSPKMHAQLLPGPNITYKFPKFIKGGDYVQEYHRAILDAIKNVSETWYVVFPKASKKEQDYAYVLRPFETDAEQEWPVPAVPGSRKVAFVSPKIDCGLLISPMDQHNSVCFFGGIFGFDKTRAPVLLKQSTVLVTG